MVDRRGTYTADRAAALSGVPKSTVHEWARQEVLVPSVSPVRVKLWSYTDLLSLRVVYWLRHPKQDPDGAEEIPATPMPEVRSALEALRQLDLEMFEDDEPMLKVTKGGELYVGPSDDPVRHDGQISLETLDLIKPFVSEDDIRGPNLVRPRKHLRIIPGKVGGAPHLEDTRLQTEAIGALARRGTSPRAIQRLYPRFDHQAIVDAIDLEEQLSRNLRPRRHSVTAAV